MTDTPEDQPDDERTARDERVSTRDVPGDADWVIVGQYPVERDAGGGLTTTVVYAIADAEGVAAREVKEPPLYEVVDTAALDTAFFGPDGGATDCSTEFMYRGFRVVVRSDGWVSVYERAE